MPRMLLIDHDAGPIAPCAATCGESDLQLITCANACDALFAAHTQQPDVIVLNLGPGGEDELDLFDRVRQSTPEVPVVVVSASSHCDSAIEAMKRGAFDFLVLPLVSDRLRSVVQRALEVSLLAAASRQEADVAADDTPADADTMIGSSAAMQEVYKLIGRATSQDVAVLVLGESGTGKELVARAVHRYSRRAEGPFVTINCAAIPEALLESELFGYERGAFTGAEQRRIGKFEHADGGTVFLDEIGDMSSATQAKVLRLIQEQQFERVGGTHSVRTDVRVIAATNLNLPEMVAEGRFRQDLYFRINGFTIELPPLRKRHGDVALLTRHFIKRFNREMGRGVHGVAPEALHWLQMNHWPGNVRELQSTIKQAMIKAAGNVLPLASFPANPLGAEPADVAPDLAQAARAAWELLVRQHLVRDAGASYRQLLQIFDEIVLDESLRFANGNQLQAAALLGISRTTLRAKLRGTGLSIEKQVSNGRR